MELGAGRRSKDDVLDLGVGIRLHRNVGDAVQVGETLFTVYAQKGAAIPEVRYRETMSLAPQPPKPSPWLLETIE